MQTQIIVTDDFISHSEEILLPPGEHFDRERIQFIKNLTTIDLQACPGSGKTTCILAKLFTLAKYLPLENNKGILVLSHSNAAVDEIKNKLIKYCPQLFEYPNFIGTIQGFVDQFLAIPYYQQTYGSLPYRIDDEIFIEKIWIPRDAQSWLNNKSNKEEILNNLRFDTDDRMVSIINLPKEYTTTYKSLYQMRKKVLEDGYLCFDDAFYLSERYIKYFPKIIDLIQKRFLYAFIDEMQDTDNRQISVLDKLFPLSGKTIVQKIGDQNQAIYSWRVKADNTWIPRSGYLTINGSKRLSTKIALAIKNISLIPQDLTGNTLRQNIKPKIILFDDLTIKNVVKKFGDIIIDLNLYQNNRAIFKAIGWRKTSKDLDKLCVGNYFNNFQDIKSKNRTDFDNLGEYLNIDLASIYQSGLGILRKNILNAIVKVIRILDIKNNNGKYYTVSSFLKLLKDSHVEKYEELNLNLYKWSISFCKGEQIGDNLREYIPRLVNNIFLLDDITQSLDTFFVSRDIKEKTSDINISKPTCIYQHQYKGININIEIGTVHSVKGETHTATLYLETFYYRDGNKSYESQRLIEQLKGNRVNNCGVRVKESLKIAYVGMSRPTTLLCFAVHKSRIPKNEIVSLQNNWDIIDITEK